MTPMSTDSSADALHSSHPAAAGHLARVQRVSTALRGKLQFMDYLVRAAVADIDRYAAEPDEGTRIFLRQLIEMHRNNLVSESSGMRLVGELTNALTALIDEAEADPGQGLEAGSSMHDGALGTIPAGSSSTLGDSVPPITSEFSGGSFS